MDEFATGKGIMQFKDFDFAQLDSAANYKLSR